jgi:hypothetical protein
MSELRIRCWTSQTTGPSIHDILLGQTDCHPKCTEEEMNKKAGVSATVHGQTAIHRMDAFNHSNTNAFSM